MRDHLARPLALLAVAALIGLGLLPAKSEAARIVDGEVRLKEAVFDSGRPQVARLAVQGAGRQVFRIDVVRRGSGRIVKGFRRIVRLPRQGGRRSVRQAWAGRTWAGDVAPPGGYEVRATLRGTSGTQRPSTVGRFMFRTHLPPVTGETGRRGAVGEFGAGRSGGRRHEGFDILAPCGRRLVATRGGRVTGVGYDPRLYGHYLKIRGRAEPYSYFYSHLIAAPPLRPGQRIRTGAYVGRVGQTGNAVTTPCHLHFEVHLGRSPIDPAPLLRAWAP